MLLYWELTTFFWMMCSMFLLTTCKCSLMSLKCWIVSYDPRPPALPCCWPTANCFSEPDNESLQTTTLVQCFICPLVLKNIHESDKDWVRYEIIIPKSWTFSKILHARWFNIKALKGRLTHFLPVYIQGNSMSYKRIVSNNQFLWDTVSQDLIWVLNA